MCWLRIASPAHSRQDVPLWKPPTASTGGAASGTSAARTAGAADGDDEVALDSHLQSHRRTCDLRL
jgi:hypothetical protein